MIESPVSGSVLRKVVFVEDVSVEETVTLGLGVGVGETLGSGVGLGVGVTFGIQLLVVLSQ